MNNDLTLTPDADVTDFVKTSETIQINGLYFTVSNSENIPDVLSCNTTGMEHLRDNYNRDLNKQIKLLNSARNSDKLVDMGYHKGIEFNDDKDRSWFIVVKPERVVLSNKRPEVSVSGIATVQL